MDQLIKTIEQIKVIKRNIWFIDSNLNSVINFFLFNYEFKFIEFCKYVDPLDLDLKLICSPI